MQNDLILATDMDRTLIPNGIQEYDGSMGIFKNIIDKEKIPLIYVTGRNLRLIDEAISEYNLPMPDYLVAEVGTMIYEQKGGKFIVDNGWIDHIEKVTMDWDVVRFRLLLRSVLGIYIQEEEKQNQFKLSYYIKNLGMAKQIVKDVKKIINVVCKDAVIVYSVDETTNTGLLDILPKKATKVSGLEFLRKKFKVKKEEIVYCGDSGNDLLPLTFGYRSILVRNAIDEVKEEVKKNCDSNKLYIAKGYKNLNGYYVSGIIEGLIRFGAVSDKYLDR